MRFDEYQQEAARTITSTFGACSEPHLVNDAFGLAGEAGEAVDLLKKHICHGHPLNREKLIEELGDLLWYVSATATELGVPLSEVAAGNVAKRQRRYPDGYTREASIARRDMRTVEGA